MGLFLTLGSQGILAQTTAPGEGQLESDRILQACSQDQAETLPIPFKDLSANHWAFKAVMNLHYCGAYRGAIPPETARSGLERLEQNSQATPSLYPMPMLP